MVKLNLLNKLYTTLAAVLLFLWFIPFIMLFYISTLRVNSLYEINWGRDLFSVKHHYSFDMYKTLLVNKQFLLSALNTLAISLTSTTLAICFAIGIAYYLNANTSFKIKKYMLFGVFVLIAVPVQITLNSNTWVFNRLNIYDSIFSIILVHVALGLPFIVVIIYNAFQKVPENIRYLAIMDDLSHVQKMMYVYVPFARNSILSISIYQIIWTGNDLIVGMTFGNEQSRPLTTFIQGQVRQFGDAYKTIVPATMLSTLIPIVLGIILLRLEQNTSK